MNSQTNNISINNIISSVTSSIDVIQDNNIKLSFLNFIKEYFTKKLNVNNKPQITTYCSAVEVISNYIKNKSLNELDWQFLCSTIHNNQLIKFIDIEGINSSNILERIGGISKQIMKSYFLYLISNSKYISPNISELRVYSYLIKESSECVNKSYLNPLNRDLLERKILTNYPLDSQPKSIYQVCDKNSPKSYNLNLNTTNDFLITLLRGFIDKLAIQPRRTPNYKIFYYYFEESFGNLNIPNTIKDFNSITFKEQIKFYGELPDKLNFNGLIKSGGKTASAVVPPQRIAVQFYIYLIDYIENLNINYNIFKNSWITKNLLKSTAFLKLYCEGYTYIHYNILEDVPIYDKWWLSSGEDAKKSTKLVQSNICINFEQVHDQNLKQKFKEWIWYGYGNSNIIRRMYGCNSILEFLEFKYKYDESFKKVNFLYKEKVEFSMDLFYRFRIFVENKYSNKRTLSEHLIDIRSFLNSISKEYNINKKCYKYLSVKDKYSEDIHGCPITKKDFKLILDEFKALEGELDYGILLTNIFYISSTTNLRPGEILSLERNCITYKDSNGNGTIRLKRKTSKGTFVHQELDAETIKLIESSILISNDWSQLMEKVSDRNYIFIGQTISNSFGNNYQRLSGAFSNNFRDIIVKLDSKLDNYYTPYNLRDTFINIVYDNYEKYDENDIEKLKRITGNSYHVVMKHYRRKFAVKEYVEVMAKIVVSNVDINGNILEDESSIANNFPVNEDLGVCKLSNCKPNRIERYDLENQCLFCNNFITSLSRIKAFEKKIQSIRERIDSISNNDFVSEAERNFLLIDLKLCCSYLTKMLEIKKSLS